jgi:hypothetical protein
MRMRSRLRTPFLVLACLLAVTCADPAQPADEGEAAGTPASLSFTYELKSEKAFYVEGALQFVRVSGQGMTQEEEIPFEESLAIEVPRGGEYQIESWARPCAGNCGSLDPPTDRCSASVVVPDGAAMQVMVSVIVMEPCTIDAGGEVGMGLDHAGPPLAGGERSTMDELASVFGFPFAGPDTAIATDETIHAVWLRDDREPQAYIEYASGVVVTVRRAIDAQGTGDFAEAQLTDGVPGSLVEVGGVEAFEVPPNVEGAAGSVRFVLGDALVTVVGNGEYPLDQLREIAASIVEANARR